jgi:hypothetical protein
MFPDTGRRGHNAKGDRMPSRFNLRRRAFRVGLAVGLSALASAGYAQRGPAGPFAGLGGSWSGTGTLRLQEGGTERVRCRATYVVGEGGSALQQNLRCASDSYRFDLSTHVTYHGGAISGSWSETTRNVRGGVSGRASSGEIDARVDGPGFAANLALTTRGDRQNVSIASAGTELSGLSITLTRGSR